MEKKKLLTRRDALLLLALLAAAFALALWLDSRPAAVTAIIESDGTPVLTQDLASLSEPTITTIPGQNGHTVTIELTPTGARFLTSTCPDQTCVRTGSITHTGETALCLPARITLRLAGPTGRYDAVTY